MDPLTIGTAVAQPAWVAIRSLLGRNNIISAYFDALGQRLHGDERIVVEKSEVPESKRTWYFDVKDLDGYVFTRIAVGADAAIEQFGTELGETNPDPRYFRWIAPVLPGRIYGGPSPNALVSFVVVGYKPRVLVRELSGDQ